MYPMSSVVRVAVAFLILAACTRAPEPAAVPASAPAAAAVQRANPASENCVARGGRLAIEALPSGAQYGICMFEDNRQCEEWALLRGECPVGGRRITGYATAAGRYCAITGGEYTVISGSDAADERGECALPNGKRCDADAYYRGECVR